MNYVRIDNTGIHDIEQENIWSVEDTRLHPDIRLRRHELHRLPGFLSPKLWQVIVTVYYNGHTQEDETMLQIPLAPSNHGKGVRCNSCEGSTASKGIDEFAYHR